MADKTRQIPGTAYYFEATVRRKGEANLRSGSVTTNSPKQALDLIDEIVDGWSKHVTVERLKVYEVLVGGEIGDQVASTIYPAKSDIQVPPTKQLPAPTTPHNVVDIKSLSQVGTPMTPKVPPVYSRKHA